LNNDWQVYPRNHKRTLKQLPPPPPWRRLGAEGAEQRAQSYLPSEKAIEAINAALYLRRPLLVRGNPGVGKSSLAFSVAHQLELGPVLHWPVSSSSLLRDALYRYDAIGRLQAVQVGKPGDIDGFVELGPVGTAYASSRLRVLLIDEIDKGDIDLPNDLLNVLEDRWFEIPELRRETRDFDVIDSERNPVRVKEGRVNCGEQPLVIMTDNMLRDFPPAFKRRCLHLEIKPPDEPELMTIVQRHFPGVELPQLETLIQDFLSMSKTKRLSTDQLLNAVYLTLHVPQRNPFEIKDPLGDIVLSPND